jgi:hypothetical protein
LKIYDPRKIKKSESLEMMGSGQLKFSFENVSNAGHPLIAKVSKK